MTQEEKLLQINRLCYRINNETIATAFFTYSGHVNWVEAQVFLAGWQRWKKPDFQTRVTIGAEDADEQLDRLRAKLEEMLLVIQDSQRDMEVCIHGED